MSLLRLINQSWSILILYERQKRTWSVQVKIPRQWREWFRCFLPAVNIIIIKITRAITIETSKVRPSSNENTSMSGHKVWQSHVESIEPSKWPGPVYRWTFEIKDSCSFSNHFTSSTSIWCIWILLIMSSLSLYKRPCQFFLEFFIFLPFMLLFDLWPAPLDPKFDIYRSDDLWSQPGSQCDSGSNSLTIWWLVRLKLNGNVKVKQKIMQYVV